MLTRRILQSIEEPAQSEDLTTLTIRESCVNLERNHKDDMSSDHFVRLRHTDARLQCKQVLDRKTISLCEDLPPAILAGRFDGEHRQALDRFFEIVVRRNRREKKVGP